LISPLLFLLSNAFFSFFCKPNDKQAYQIEIPTPIFTFQCIFLFLILFWKQNDEQKYQNDIFAALFTCQCIFILFWKQNDKQENKIYIPTPLFNFPMHLSI